MKVLIKAKTEQGKIVIEELIRLGNIFSKPALRFSLRCTLPKKYRRGVLSFRLIPSDDGVLYSQGGNVEPKHKSKILEAVDKLIEECSGTPQDCTKELIL